MFRGAPARLGRTTRPFPRQAPRILWRGATGRPIFSSPAVDGDGTVVVGSLDGHVYAFSASGKLRWRRDLGDRIYASPALTTAGVVIGSDADQLQLLERASGRPLWTFKLGPCPPPGPGRGPETVRCDADSSPLVAPDGTLYLGGDALYALAEGGKLRWKLALEGHALSSPALAPDGTLYLGVQGGALIAATIGGHAARVGEGTLAL